MSIIKKKVKHNNENINIRFSLSNSNEFTGYQQGIDELTKFSLFDAVNPENDFEKRRFKSSMSNDVYIRFLYYDSDTGQHEADFRVNQFERDDFLSKNINKINNSFYILEFYDSFHTYNQNIISSTYQTKNFFIQTVTIEDWNFIYRNPSLISLSSSENTQFYKINIPQWYINSFNVDETIIGYVKFKFYNAKTGRVVLFYNSDNEMLNTPEKHYFKCELNQEDYSWKIVTPSINNNNDIIAKELPYDSNEKYIDRINDRVDVLDDIKQKYPIEKTFDYENRKLI